MACSFILVGRSVGRSVGSLVHSFGFGLSFEVHSKTENKKEKIHLHCQNGCMRFQLEFFVHFLCGNVMVVVVVVVVVVVGVCCAVEWNNNFQRYIEEHVVNLLFEWIYECCERWLFEMTSCQEVNEHLTSFYWINMTIWSWVLMLWLHSFCSLPSIMSLKNKSILKCRMQIFQMNSTINRIAESEF